MRAVDKTHCVWLAGVALSLLAACATARSESPQALGKDSDPSPAATSSAQALVSIEPRSTHWPTFPCTQCHEHTPGRSDPRERQLTEFHAWRLELDHGALEGWCYRCHLQANLDELLLPDGSSVAFDDSHEHCGACHGDKMADWRDGIHGLSTGRFDGPRLARTCAHCHNPHRPRFPEMIAEPAPPRPRTERGAPSPQGAL